MAGKPLELPAFVQLRYAENGVFSKLKSEAAEVSGVVRREFANMGDELEKSLRASIRGATSGGVNLGVDQMREAVRQRQALADAAELTARAARRAAEGAGVESRELLQAAAAAEALAAKEREAAMAVQYHADVIGKVQAELVRETGAVDTLTGAHRRGAVANDNSARSAGAHRAAMAMLGQQMQDVTVQAQMGTSAFTILAQQGGQTAYALSGMGGTVGRVASFFAGPWGAAIIAGTTILGPLIAGLINTGDAAEDSADALNLAKAASDGLSGAQSTLGEMFDLTTGKIRNQNDLLLLNAKLQAVNLRAEAAAAKTTAMTAANAAGQRSWSEVVHDNTPLRLAWKSYPTPAKQRLQGVLSGRVDPSEAVTWAEKQNFSGLNISKQDYIDAVARAAEVAAKTKTAELIDKSLADRTLAPELRKPASAKSKPTSSGNGAAKAEAEANRMRKAGESAAEAIARINERFDQAPRLIDQTAAATRELDAIIADLSRRDPIKFKDTIADAQAAKIAVQEGLLRPMEDARRESERRLAVQDLLATGRDEEAAKLQAIWNLEDKLGSEEALRAKVASLIADGRKDEAAAFERILAMYPDMKRQAAELAEIDAERTRQAERQRAIFEAQQNVLQTARNDLTSILSGRKTNIFGDLKKSFGELRGQMLFDGIFGDVFAELEKAGQSKTPLGKATARLETGVHSAAGSIEGLASAVEAATSRISRSGNVVGASGGTSAGTDLTDSDLEGLRAAIDAMRASRTMGWDGRLNPSGALSVAGDGSTPDMVVTLKRPFELANKSAMDLADRLSNAMFTPLQELLSSALGPEFAQMLGGVMKGAFSGWLTGGKPGGILGGLKGIVEATGVFGGKDGKVAEKLGKAGEGASMGTQTAGIMKALGIKTSTTGAQIGGSIGAMSGIPGGDIIGSVIGGLIGGALKKVKWGRVDLTSGGVSSAFGNSGKSKEAASSTGNSIYSSLQNIVDQFGGTMGDFGSISVGVRHGDYRVNTGGTSLKKAKGAKDFNEDAEAAMKYAIKTAIDRGAVAGIKESTSRLLKAGDDLDAALQDALDWEGAFRELKSIKDPLGSALDDLDKQFTKLIDLANQAGASSEEMAQLQELYSIKSAAAIEDAKDRIVGSLKDLLDELTIGDNGLSLRDRRTAALGNYNTLAARVAAGDSTAYDDYAKAAQDLIAIERDLYGSQQEYFDRLNEVTSLTQSRVAAETNVVSIAENRDSPFDSTGAVKSSIDSQTSVLGSQLAAVNINIGDTNAALARIEAALAGSGVASLAFASNF